MRYMINDAPIGGWVDRETGTSFTDNDPNSQVYLDFQDWLDAGNTPDPPDPLPVDEVFTVPEHLQTIGEPMSDDDVVNALHHLREYFEFESPNDEYTSATLKTLIRLVVNKYGAS